MSLWETTSSRVTGLYFSTLKTRQAKLKGAMKTRTRVDCHCRMGGPCRWLYPSPSLQWESAARRSFLHLSPWLREGKLDCFGRVNLEQVTAGDSHASRDRTISRVKFRRSLKFNNY